MVSKIKVCRNLRHGAKLLLTHSVICCADEALEWNFVWTSCEACKWLRKNEATIEKEPVWVYLVNEDTYLKVKEKFEQL